VGGVYGIMDTYCIQQRHSALISQTIHNNNNNNNNNIISRRAYISERARLFKNTEEHVKYCRIIILPIANEYIIIRNIIIYLRAARRHVNFEVQKF